MLAADAIATGGDPAAVATRYARDGRPRARARPALRRVAPARAAVPARRAGSDPCRGPHAVDPSQLRALDVRGLSPRHPPHTRPLAPGHAHAAGQRSGRRPDSVAVVIFTRLTAKPGRRDELLEVLDDLAEATRAEPGNEVFIVHAARDEPDVVLGYEVFADDEAVAEHRATDAVRVAPRAPHRPARRGSGDHLRASLSEHAVEVLDAALDRATRSPPARSRGPTSSSSNAPAYPDSTSARTICSIGMSPSPGTARSGVRERPDHEVAQLDVPQHVRAPGDGGRQPPLGEAAVHLHAHADAEGARQIDAVAQRGHEAQVEAQGAGRLDRDRERVARPVPAPRRAAVAAASHSSGCAGPVVSTTHTPNVDATPRARSRRSCCAGHVARSARSHQPSSTTLLTRSPAAVIRATASSTPASSSFRNDRPT